MSNEYVQGPNPSFAAVKTRSVISVLLFPHSASPQILLFRRSLQVRTYQQKLSPIAGSIESSDLSSLAAAWRELEEETGLGPNEIELWRRGIGFEFTDDSARRRWKVSPFAFRFRQGVDEKNIKIDWEHVGFEWRTVEEVLNGRIRDDSVPRLETTVAQVWVDQKSALGRVLEDLKSDHEHGARELATKAVEGLISIVDDDDFNVQNTGNWWEHLRRQAFHLAVNARPSMGAAISAAVVAALGRMKAELDRHGGGSESDLSDRIKEILASYLEERSNIVTRVGEQFSNFLRKVQDDIDHSPTDPLSSEDADLSQRKSIKILTLSSSSTIRSALIYALTSNPTLQIDLSILESRPLYEGVTLAKSLINEAQRLFSSTSSSSFHSRLNITLAPDSSVALLSKQGIDLVLLGADRISAAGDVSNKTGSFPTVLTVKTASKADQTKVIVVSEVEKIVSTDINGDANEEEEENDELEVMKDWNLDLDSSAALEGSHGGASTSTSKRSLWLDMVRVRNVYFEWVPAEYIDGYLCEEGLWGKEEIRRRAGCLDQLFEGVLGPETDTGIRRMRHDGKNE